MMSEECMSLSFNKLEPRGPPAASLSHKHTNSSSGFLSRFLSRPSDRTTLPLYTNRIRRDLNKNTRSITIKASWDLFFNGLVFISSLGSSRPGSARPGSARPGPPCQHPVLQLRPGCRDYRDGDGGKESKNRGERKWAW